MKIQSRQRLSLVIVRYYPIFPGEFKASLKKNVTSASCRHSVVSMFFFFSFGYHSKLMMGTKCQSYLGFRGKHNMSGTWSFFVFF